MSSSSTWVAAHLTCPFWRLKMAFLKSRLLPVTPIWVVKTSTTEWSTTSLQSSNASSRKTSLAINVQSVAYGQHVSAPSAPFPPVRRPALRSTLCMKVLTSTLPSPEHVLRSSMLTFSVVHWSRWKVSAGCQDGQGTDPWHCAGWWLHSHSQNPKAASGLL